MKKNELFELIKSLSKSEKRYFKVFCNQLGSETNYIKLFDALDNQEVFDEAAIRQQFDGELFLKQLHVVKNYLRQMILKSLRNYHSSISKNAALKDLLRNVEILFNKELYMQCETELIKAERMAREYELKPGLIETIGWKRKLEQALRPQNFEGIAMIVNEQQAAISNLKNAHDYWQLATDLSTRLIGNNTSKVAASPLLSDARNATSVEAKVLYFNSLYIYYMQGGKPEAAAFALKELLDFLRKKEKMMAEDPTMYLSTLNNLLSYLVFQKDYDGALGWIANSRVFFKKWKLKSSKKSLMKQYLRTCNIELEIYRTQKSWKDHAAFIEEMEEYVMLHKAKVPGDYLLSFWFQFSYLNFMQGKYDRALNWVNLILGTKLKKIRVDLQMQVRLLNLMIHLEQRNYFVLRYFVDSTRRFFKKAKEVKPHEKILFKFFTKMGRAAEYDWKRHFKELDHALFNADLEDPSLNNSYIDFKAWIGKYI